MTRGQQPIHKVFGTPYFDEDICLRRFYEHNAEMRAYFADRKEDFLEIDITKGDQWPQICTFLNVPVPEAPFPWKNKSDALDRRVHSPRSDKKPQNQNRPRGLRRLSRIMGRGSRL